MMDILIIRLEAPLMSFGAPIVDQNGVIQSYPALSLITGLLGNALGYKHKETNKLESLQRRIRYASRQDRAGLEIRDYQTVDLSQDFMTSSHAWTTRDRIEKRKGGSASKGTHIRIRDYRADAIHTVALTLIPSNIDPDLDAIENALRFPSRPLFIGRKTCIPSSPLLTNRMQADSLIIALQRTGLPIRADKKEKYRAWWPADEKEHPAISDIDLPITDHRDWHNQIHVGQRWIATGEIQIKLEE